MSARKDLNIDGQRGALREAAVNDYEFNLEIATLGDRLAAYDLYTRRKATLGNGQQFAGIENDTRAYSQNRRRIVTSISGSPAEPFPPNVFHAYVTGSGGQPLG